MSAEKPEIGDVWENDYFRPYNPFYTKFATFL